MGLTVLPQLSRQRWEDAFLICLDNPNYQDNKNDGNAVCLPANEVHVLEGDISVANLLRWYQITNFQLLADCQHDMFVLPATGEQWRSLALHRRHAQQSKRRV